MPVSFMRTLASSAMAMVAMAMTLPAHATETSFATFTGLGTSFVATNSGAGGSLTLTDTSVVNFGFLATNLTTAVSGIPANLVFTATSPNSNYSTPFAFLGVADQTVVSGSLTFASTQAITIGSTTYAAGSNLLTAHFSNATLLGILGQQNAGLTADGMTGTLVYTSDFLSFANTVSRDYSISLGAIVAPLTSGTVAGLPAFLQGFTSTPTGSFASDPVPLSNAAVPEPATWAMMLVGLGAVGVSLRGRTRRRLQAA